MKTINEKSFHKMEQKPAKPGISFVCLVCCTCKRPKMLSASIKSLNFLKIPENLRTELVIVDNDGEESAKAVVEKLAPDLNFPVHYVTEPERGLSNARNRALEEVIKLGASHILFFDDDELMDKNCLIEHIKLYNDNPDAYISSGPTITEFVDRLPFYIRNHLVFKKQKTTKKTGLIRNYCACGNVFFPVSLIKDYGLRFSSEYVFMGGEDGEFFSRASALGFTIIWNNEAVIYEMVSKSRANIGWILKKCYYNGYAGTMLKFKGEKSKTKKLLFLCRQSIVLALDILILLPSVLAGPLCFFNVLGTCFYTKGKIDGIIKGTPIEFYRDIYGE